MHRLRWAGGVPWNYSILTGMSGAGKATAARVLEDLAYTVVDNLPPLLLPELARREENETHSRRLVAVIDARSGGELACLDQSLVEVRAMGFRPFLLFIDASDTVLVQRFKETRRPHPLFEEQGGILQAIQAERHRLEGLKEQSDKVVDTSDLKPHHLLHELTAYFRDPQNPPRGLTVTVSSFGFKYGLPLDADLVFDVRFLVNPHYEDNLRAYDGRDQVIDDYVMRDPDSPLLLEKLRDLLDFSLPRYVEEGKAYLTVAIGCTGGRHRSVVVAERLGSFLRERGYRVLVQHRDVARDPAGGLPRP